MAQVYIGTTTKLVKYGGDRLFLTKHELELGRYWTFGYLGNSRLHTHFKTLFLIDLDIINIDVAELFATCIFSNDDWVNIKRLFGRAYYLSESGEDSNDLELVLDEIWSIVMTCYSNYIS